LTPMIVILIIFLIKVFIGFIFPEFTMQAINLIDIKN